MHAGRRLQPAFLLLLSGAAALVYQTVWIKQLSLVVGVDVHAVATTVSAFFAGLAAGSFLLGRRADTQAQPLRVFAWLGAGTAVLGITTTLLLARAAEPFVWLRLHAGALAWLLPFAIVAVPACLMGGTLPAMLRATAPEADDVGRRGGT